jgi:cyclohexadienyl dehydratase
LWNERNDSHDIFMNVIDLSVRRVPRCIVAGLCILSFPVLAHAGAGSAPPSRLDEFAFRGTLRACTTGDYIPYSYIDQSGNLEGIDVEMVNLLAESLHVKTTFIKTTWPKFLDDFTAECDIGIGGVSTTLERQKQAFFSVPYQIDGKTPITRCVDTKKYQTVAQIDQPFTRVIVDPGGTNELYARQHFRHAKLIVYPDNVTIFKQIVDGKADVMVTDASETLLQQKLNPSLCSVHPEQPFQYGEKAWLLPRGDVVFQQYVDQWLHLLQRSGKYEAIRDQWLK